MNRVVRAPFIAMLVALTGFVHPASSADPPLPYLSFASNVLDEAEEWYVRITLPANKTFCSIDGKDGFGWSPGRDGYFVPLMLVNCEDYVRPNAPARVHFTFHHNVLDDEWEANREYCAKNAKEPNDAFLTEIKFTDLGKIGGFRAQRCVRAFRPNEDNAKGYYMNQITIFRGTSSDDAGGAHYVITARGDIEYRARLDAFLSQVLKGVKITPFPKK